VLTASGLRRIAPAWGSSPTAWAGCIAEAVDARESQAKRQRTATPRHLRQIQMDRLLLLIHIGRSGVGSGDDVIGQAERTRWAPAARQSA